MNEFLSYERVMLGSISKLQLATLENDAFNNMLIIG